MIQIDILKLIPDNLRIKFIDALVDFVFDQAKKYISEDIASNIKKLRSDAAFRKSFEDGLQRASKRFITEYETEDEDLVAAIATDKNFFKNEVVQSALLAILKQPGAYLVQEKEAVVQSFDTILPSRKNRERVNRAVMYFLKCLAEELWHLPELQPIYTLQFQRITAEGIREQVTLQKIQVQALVGLDVSIRESLLRLIDVIAEQRLQATNVHAALPPPTSESKLYQNLPQPDYTRFIGREGELNKVVQLLRPYPHSRIYLITIDGIGGVGKTALALEVAHRYLRNFKRIPKNERFEAIIWTSGKRERLTSEGIIPRYQVTSTLNDIFTTIAATLQREDITRARPQEQAEIVRNALTQQSTLLIVDNLETIDDEQVIAFLRELPAPTIAIVTTRHWIDSAYPVRLTGMPEKDALALIDNECTKKDVTLERNQARKLFSRTGGVPLAIVWSIAQIGYGYDIETVLRRLGHPTESISRFCFGEVVEHIHGTDAYKLLLALSIFATDASRESLGYVAGLDMCF